MLLNVMGIVLIIWGIKILIKLVGCIGGWFEYRKARKNTLRMPFSRSHLPKVSLFEYVKKNFD